MKSTQIEEKRVSRRFPLQLPIAVTNAKKSRSTKTENISAGGVLFYADEKVKVGSAIAFTIRMPAGVLGAPQDVLVNCTGRVVRRSRIKKRDAVAVVIDEYDFERC